MGLSSTFLSETIHPVSSPEELPWNMRLLLGVTFCVFVYLLGQKETFYRRMACLHCRLRLSVKTA
jgi:hypothetical protein